MGPGGRQGDVAIYTVLLRGRGAVGRVHSYCSAPAKEACRARREFGHFVEL